jgi:disulfide bond formation protein DsbB
MTDLIRRHLPLAALVLALAPLAVALAAQYVGGLAPCPLCHWQRYPYVAAALLAGAALYTRGQSARALVILAALAILASAGLAAFHVGVEQKWWEGTAGCAGGIDFSELTVEEIQQALEETAPARCDEPAWTFLGISMAGYNLIYGAIAGLVLLTIAAWPCNLTDRR